MSLADDDDEQIDWGFDDDEEPAVVSPAAADEVAQQHLPALNPAAVSPARAPATPPAAADVGSPSQVEVSPSTATVVGSGDGAQGGSLVDLEGLANTRLWPSLLPRLASPIGPDAEALPLAAALPQPAGEISEPTHQEEQVISLDGDKRPTISVASPRTLPDSVPTPLPSVVVDEPRLPPPPSSLRQPLPVSTSPKAQSQTRSLLERVAPEWESRFSKDTGEKYWFDQSSGRSSWQAPTMGGSTTVAADEKSAATRLAPADVTKSPPPSSSSLLERLTDVPLSTSSAPSQHPAPVESDREKQRRIGREKEAARELQKAAWNRPLAKATAPASTVRPAGPPVSSRPPLSTTRTGPAPPTSNSRWPERSRDAQDPQTGRPSRADDRPISSVVAHGDLRAEGGLSLGRLADPNRELGAFSNEQREGRGVEGGSDSRYRGASPRRSTPTGPRSPDRRPSDSWRPAPEDLPALDRRASRERPPHLGRRSRSRSPLRASSSHRPTSRDEPALSVRASDRHRSPVRSSRTRTPPPPITSRPTSFLGPSYNPAVTSLLGADVNRILSRTAPMRRWGGSAGDGGGTNRGPRTATKVEDTPVTATESRTGDTARLSEIFVHPSRSLQVPPPALPQRDEVVQSEGPRSGPEPLEDSRASKRLRTSPSPPPAKSARAPPSAPRANVAIHPSRLNQIASAPRVPSAPAAHTSSGVVGPPTGPRGSGARPTGPLADRRPPPSQVSRNIVEVAQRTYGVAPSQRDSGWGSRR